MREVPPRIDELTAEQYSSRLPAVHKILYLLFTEGYLSSHAETAIRQELCDEAIRLASVLAGHPVGRAPETSALLALMHLHVARITARQDASGGLILLAEQDRALWDQEKIQVGLSWLADSARGDVFSRYHAEAGIAAVQHPRPLVRADALGQGRRMLFAAGADRPLRAAHAQPRGSCRRVARARRGACGA